MIIGTSIKGCLYTGKGNVVIMPDQAGFKTRKWETTEVQNWDLKGHIL